MQSKIYIGNKNYTTYLEHLTDQTMTVLKEAGVQSRQIVALAVADSLYFLAIYEACLRIGAVPAILGNVTKPEEIAMHIQAHTLCRLNSDGVLVVHQIDVQEPRTKLPAEISIICRTSGSTDNPKFVMWSSTGIEYQSDATISHLGYGGAEEGILLTIPIWGAYGISVVNIWKKMRCTLVLPEQFRPRYLSNLIHSRGVTIVETMPVMLQNWYRWFVSDRDRMSLLKGVKVWDSGGDLLPFTLAKNWKDELGVPILDGYGLCEAGPNVSLNSPTAWKISTIGKPLSGTEVKINGKRELSVKSPSVMAGYWPPHLHESAIDADGWLSTGDLAEFDADGFIRLLGRTKNILIVNGYNVIPEVVEETLCKHSQVERAYVVGHYQGAKGHRVYAFIVPIAGSDIKTIDLRKHSEEWLEAPSRPHQYVLIDKVPVKSSGKVDRQALLELLP